MSYLVTNGVPLAVGPGIRAHFVVRASDSSPVGRCALGGATVQDDAAKVTLAQVVVVRPLSAGLVLSGVRPTEVGVHGPVLATGVCAKWRNGGSFLEKHFVLLFPLF